MTIDKEFLQRDSNITAKVVADSISESGQRITTFELEYMRFLHSEIMTHRMLSKNCSSSRAIPIEKMLGLIENNMAVPVYFGKNQSGMKAVEEVEYKTVALNLWKTGYTKIKEVVDALTTLGLHKQIANRLTEPFQMMKVVVTATEWDNFFNLRIDKDAQPELVLLADKMYNAMQGSTPKTLKHGQWHLPYVDVAIADKKHEVGKSENDQYYFLADGVGIDLYSAIKLSVASCAAVSYRTEGMTMNKADKIYHMLINAENVHSSPFEHVAMPMKDSCVQDMVNNKPPTGWEKGVTNMRRDGKFCSGNFTGWIQYRHLLNNNTCNDFNYNNRMEDF